MARQIKRRMFLQGAAGFSLAIPFLPSLAPRDAAAQSTSVKRFVAFGTEHGGVWQSNMYPDASTLTQTSSYAGHQIRRGALVPQIEGDMAVLSPVLRAASHRLTPALAQKLNVLRGFDIPFDIGHNSGSYLGNYAANLAEGGVGHDMQDSPLASLDQVLAWSPSFYGDLGTILERSLVMGLSSMSYGWSNPSNQSGDIQRISPQESNLALFERIFVPPAENPEELRPPVVDRILEDYRRLRDGNRRLSSGDRQRLTEHLDRLDELERRLSVVVSCEDIESPTVASDSVDLENGGQQADIQYWQLMNDVIVAAFACDTCRIATGLLNEVTHFSDYPGGWHQEVAHQADYVTWSAPPVAHPQDILTESKQAFFEHVFLDLAAKLDAIADPHGQGTLLDGTLLQWSQESGVATHESIECPVVTAGSAGGYFQTGHYCDYRDENAPFREAEPGFVVNSHRGLIYNQWLGTVAQSMGLDPSEYETGGHGGYGQVAFGFGAYYPSTGPVVDAMGDPVPLITS